MRCVRSSVPVIAAGIAFSAVVGCDSEPKVVQISKKKGAAVRVVNFTSIPLTAQIGDWPVTPFVPAKGVAPFILIPPHARRMVITGTGNGFHDDVSVEGGQAYTYLCEPKGKDIKVTTITGDPTHAADGHPVLRVVNLTDQPVTLTGPQKSVNIAPGQASSVMDLQAGALELAGSAGSSKFTAAPVKSVKDGAYLGVIFKDGSSVKAVTLYSNPPMQVAGMTEH